MLLIVVSLVKKTILLQFNIFKLNVVKYDISNDNYSPNVLLNNIFVLLLSDKKG